MIYELINSTTHGNNVVLYKCIANDRYYYKKVAFTLEANNVLTREKEGYDWFFKETGRDNTVKLHKKYYFELDMPNFADRSFPSSCKINSHKDLIRQIINFYKRYWPKTEKFSVHGDLGPWNTVLDNRGEIHLLDWEHFHLAQKEFWGFDVINMLFISLCHQYRSINRIGRGTLDFLKECYGLLTDSVDSSNKILSNPFVNSRKYIIDHHKVFGANFENKFILVSHLPEELDMLDSIVM